MAEFRFDPLTASWVIIASSRQDRPTMPKDYCPFCPGSGKVPDGGYDVLRYPNDFPAMQTSVSAPDEVATDFFKAEPTYGRCEVILYSDKHNGSMAELSDENTEKLAYTYRELFNEYKNDEKIKYIYIFENKGEEVGVTMPHPHGQAYGYGFMPQKIELEAQNAQAYHSKNGKCLFCDMLKNEIDFAKRIVFTDKYFTAFIPFASQYPYGIYLFSNNHIPSIDAFSDEMLRCLTFDIRRIARMYDCVFDRPFPYMMAMHNAPVNSGDFEDTWHFHIEFYPPLRAKDKIKFNASSETGAWAHCNPTCPEQKAEELRLADSKASEIYK